MPAMFSRHPAAGRLRTISFASATVRSSNAALRAHCQAGIIHYIRGIAGRCTAWSRSCSATDGERVVRAPGGAGFRCGGASARLDLELDRLFCTLGCILECLPGTVGTLYDAPNDCPSDLRLRVLDSSFSR